MRSARGVVEEGQKSWSSGEGSRKYRVDLFPGFYAVEDQGSGGGESAPDPVSPHAYSVEIRMSFHFFEVEIGVEIGGGSSSTVSLVGGGIFVKSFKNVFL